MPPEDAPPPPARPATRWWRAFVLLPVAALSVAVVAWSGAAGWRGGPVVVTALLVVGLGGLSVVLSRGLPRAGAYVFGTVVVALAGVAIAVDAAPLSHGRLEESLDGVSLPFASARATDRRGHGWCSPSCPTVVREIRFEGRSAAALYRPVIVALDAAGLVPRDERRSFLTRALSYDRLGRGAIVDHRRFTTVVRLRDAQGVGIVTIEVRSRRGVKAQPDAPRPLPG